MNLIWNRTNMLDRQYSSWKGKTVVISGCDSGLGFSLAHRCIERGSKVVAGCLDPEGLGAQQLRKIGVEVHRLDLTDDATIPQMAQSVLENHDVLQAVVNNAGLMVFGEFEWQTPRQISQQIQVNFTGALNFTYAFLPKIRADKGRVINVVSHCALEGLPSLSVYGATKAALLNWSDSLRIEQAKYGVRVIAFTPGSFYGNSGIMANQARNAEEMLNNMDPEKKAFHLEYFTKVQNYLSQIPKPSGPSIIPDDQLLDKMMTAVFADNPSSSYKHEPLRYSVYHLLFKITPTWLRDILIEYFVALPNYKSIQ